MHSNAVRKKEIWFKDNLHWSIKTKIPLPVGHKPELDIYDPTDLATDECLLFSYTVFEFISSAGSDNNLKLSCNVKGEDFDI